MGRTRKQHKGAKPNLPPPTQSQPVVSAVSYTPHELLTEAAALIASCDYETAKDACAHAVEGAIAEGDGTVTRDAFEILGTIELELGELDQAREVSQRFFFPSCRGARAGVRGAPRSEFMSDF